MKELVNLAEALKSELNKKENELQTIVDCNQNRWAHLANRRNEVTYYFESIMNVTKDSFLKSERLKNYTNDAERIIKEIRQI